MVEETENTKLRQLLALMNKEYNFIGGWYGNGCEHGFKPACSCPNSGCADAEMQRLWDELMTPNEELRGPQRPARKDEDGTE